MLLRVLIFWNWIRVTMALWNAARWKPAYQGIIRDTPTFKLARNAVDGSRNAHMFRAPHCTNTIPPWWMVDLQGQYLVKRIMITNRSDCCSHRLQRFRIEFSDSDPRFFPGFPHAKRGQLCYRHGATTLASGDNYFDCAEGTEGRFGMVVLDKDYETELMLCEVEVLVESVESRSIKYENIHGARATDSPFLTLNITDQLSCASECNKRRDEELCTAFNWHQKRHECRLLNNNPYNPMDQSSDPSWDLYRIITV